MEKLFVIKIGGNVIDDDDKLNVFLQKFAAIDHKKILVHGGGKLATRLAEQMHVPQQMINGRRITDAETLKIVVMVYAGYINKNIVATLQAKGCNAAGFTGADGGCIKAHKRFIKDVDYGFVGDVDQIKAEFFNTLLSDNITVVMAPITADEHGQLLNTNADTISQEIAKSLCDLYYVEMIYCFEKSGVLNDAEDDTSVVPQLNYSAYTTMVREKKVHSGMIPKLESAFAAINSGVKKVVIGKAEHVDQLINGYAGTTIIQ
ncbi:MAG: acetylglutamate kinase [Ginsengibacter sp.]